MITAITGKSGSGKSYIASKFDNKIIFMDIEVRDAYKLNEKVIDKVKTLFVGNAKQVLEEGYITFCKKTLCELFILYPVARTRLEDFLFTELIMPHIEKARISNENLIVDGVLPKYLHNFDQVIYVERREEDRIKDLKEKRNRTDEQIKEIDILQEGMFPKMLKGG